MPRLLLAMLAAMMVFFISAPAAAATEFGSSESSWAHIGGADAFAQPALSDDELMAVHGTGIGDRDAINVMASDQSRSYGSQASSTLSIQFDNWLNDVAAPLIVSNLIST